MLPATCGVPSEVMRAGDAGKSALMNNAPTIAPSSCANTYLPSVSESICLPSQRAKLTAGLM